MRRIILVLAVAAAMLAVMAVPAFAEHEEGPGNCFPPGTLLSEFAKAEGPNNELPGGGTPGQEVAENCTPAAF